MAKPALDAKKAKFVKAKAEGKTDIQAGLEAGAKTPVAASQYANRMSKNVEVQEALYLALERKGLTPDDIMNPVADALHSDELDMRLKGHDRAMKIVAPRTATGPTINIDFGNQANKDSQEFGI